MGGRQDSGVEWWSAEAGDGGEWVQGDGAEASGCGWGHWWAVSEMYWTLPQEEELKPPEWGLYLVTSPDSGP